MTHRVAEVIGVASLVIVLAGAVLWPRGRKGLMGSRVWAQWLVAGGMVGILLAIVIISLPLH